MFPFTISDSNKPARNSVLYLLVGRIKAGLRNDVAAIAHFRKLSDDGNQHCFVNSYIKQGFIDPFKELGFSIISEYAKEFLIVG